MALQSAMDFIHYVMNENEGRAAIRQLKPDAGLQAVVGLGRRSGYAFTEKELRMAFRIDWQMRGLHYSRKADGSSSNVDHRSSAR